MLFCKILQQAESADLQQPGTYTVLQGYILTLATLFVKTNIFGVRSGPIIFQSIIHLCLNTFHDLFYICVQEV